MRPLAFALALGLTSSPMLAQTEIAPVIYDAARVEIEYGVYCEIPTIGSEAAPDTASGVVDILSEVPIFIWSTNQVPAYPGMSFGVKTTELTGTGLPFVTIRLTHPPFLESGVSEQTYSTSIASGRDQSINAYTFDFPEEMVTGTWVLEASDAVGIIYRVEFEVVPAAELPQIAGNCEGEFLS